MKNPNSHCHKQKEKCHHHKHHGVNHGNDDEKLLFEIFKQFLKNKLEEQSQQEAPGEVPPQNVQETSETCDADVVMNVCRSKEKPKKHCHGFGTWKKGCHKKHWTKHHYGHHGSRHFHWHKKMFNHGSTPKNHHCKKSIDQNEPHHRLLCSQHFH